MAKEMAKAKIVQIVFVTKGIYDLEEPVFITFYTSMKLKSFHITCFTSTVTMVLQIVTLESMSCILACHSSLRHCCNYSTNRNKGRLFVVVLIIVGTMYM